MKKVLFLAILLVSATVSASELYIKTFGKASDPPILFLHGGPGYNAAGFGITTAQVLADRGFFVIVYDRAARVDRQKFRLHSPSRKRFPTSTASAGSSISRK